MKETLFNILKTMVLLAAIAGLFYISNMSTTSANIIKTDNPNLTIFGDNIDSSYQPYIKDGKVYISTKTVGNFIDENIVVNNILKSCRCCGCCKHYRFHVYIIINDCSMLYLENSFIYRPASKPAKSCRTIP